MRRCARDGGGEIEPGMIASETVLRDLDTADIRFKIEE